MIHLMEWNLLQGFCKPVVTQIDVLKNRYYQHSTYLDRLAQYYGEINELFKIPLKYGFLGLTVFSVLSFHISLSLLFMMSVAFLYFLDAHYQVMETRFIQLSQDLDVSEKKLCQEVSKNLDLEHQLSAAIQKNQEVTTELGVVQQEVTNLRQKIQEKEQLIESTAQIVVDSSKNIEQITSEILEIKKGVVAKAKDFLGQLSKSETLIQDFFEQSQNKDILKQSIQFREDMDSHLNRYNL